MKLERDKLYVLNTGDIVRCLATDGVVHQRPVHVTVTKPHQRNPNNIGMSYLLTEEGHAISGGLHIIREYREPRVIYINEYSFGLSGSPYLTPDAAKGVALLGRIATRKFVEVIEDE